MRKQVKMVIVDAHCDTLLEIMEKGQNIYRNDLHLDLSRIGKEKKYVQFFAAFVSPEQDGNMRYYKKRALTLIDKFYEQLKIYGDYMSLCRNYAEIKEALEGKKTAALLSVEGGEAFEGELSALEKFYELGVRSVCLTWNYRNEIASGVEDDAHCGLTEFGKEVVREMNSLGMLIDLSHMNYEGFMEVMELTDCPVIATHSNAWKICSSQRNLNDEQLLKLKENDGVTGINFYPEFLNNSGNAGIHDIINHIEYISGLIGTRHIGIGTDFDGIEYLPEGIKGVEDIGIVFNELLKLNYKQEEVNGIAGNNFLRVIGQVL
jgi:membrane dipeptidase